MPEKTEVLRAILESLPVPVLVSTREGGQILFGNRAAAKAFGLSPARLVGAHAECLYADPAARRDAMAILHRQGRVMDYEVDLKTSDGVSFRALVSWTPLDYEGMPAVCAVCVDIDTGRRAQDATRRAAGESERWLTWILQNLPGVVYRCLNDASRTMRFVSQGCRELTGYDLDELVDNRVVAYADLLDPQDRPRVWAEVQKALEARLPFQLEYRIRTRDGATKWVWEQGVGVYGDGDEVVALGGVITDISQRRAAEARRESLERQMRAAQRMEVIGSLAGGIAHDFNNVLTVIQSSAEMLEEVVAEGTEERGDLEEIHNAVAHAAGLTRQLLAFGRRQIQELRVLDLNQVIGELDRMLRRILREDIQRVMRLAPELWPVRADVAQMEQVLLNLIINARDAMPDGGKLILETANVTLPETHDPDTGVPVPAGEYVLLAVTDTGVGMDRETQLRVFEPFFTTKERGKGTGLGLSTVYGIVKQSGGTIWVHSEPGRGTTFKVYLPRVREIPDELPPRREAPRNLEGTETILLVEDEAPVRRATARVLRSRGYQVLQARDGNEAVRLVEEHGAAIDLILTDVVMPGMGGRDLVHQLSRERPGLRVVYTSGYPDQSIATHGVLEPGAHFVQKPFTPDTLLAKIRRVLDGEA